MVNEEAINAILNDNENSNTTKSDKKVNKIFNTYLQQINEGEYYDYSTKELDKTLATFWFAISPQKEGSEHNTLLNM